MTRLGIDVWTWNEIEREWLQGARIAVGPGETVAAFERVEEVFGRGWIDARRVSGPAVVAGPRSALGIVHLGAQLGVLSRVEGQERLVEKLRSEARDAFAELDAISLLSPPEDAAIEYEPEVVVGHRRRYPDFAIKRAEELPTYVEVVQPDRAALASSLQEAMAELGALVSGYDGRWTAEVFLDRQPTRVELARVREVAEAALESGRDGELELHDGLGTIYLNDMAPGLVVLDDRGRPYTPRLGLAQAAAEQGETMRHLTVRMPYFDARAAQFLAHEAAQLPATSPGIVMVEVAGASGALKKWPDALSNELALGLYDAVSGICLFQRGQVATNDGEALETEHVTIVNPSPAHPLPAWLERQLRN
jgi:hypothetical protein